MQRSFSDDIHLSAEQILQVLLESHVIHEARSLFHVDEKIEIAIGPFFPASSRPKEPHVLRPVLAGEA
jgi:hypothetical protein